MVQKLQTALRAKAKGEPTFRFYSLYDKVYRSDVLAYAYRRCKANRGAPGVDGQTFADIEAYSRQRWLGELARELKEKAYRPQAVRRVWIPKPNGKQRPLGIPTIRDRVVQMAVLLVVGPIFDVDLQPEQHAYRQGHSGLDAVRAVHRLVSTGHTEVVDADLSGYFDSIPHGALIKSVARRISDKGVLRLIKAWLKAPVAESPEHAEPPRNDHGTPQGAPVSPLLANLYMRRFLLAWKLHGHEKRLDAHIVNYADDFVICCRGTAAEADRAMRDLMRRLALTVNEDKTHVCRLPDDSVDFLGYTIGRCYSRTTGRSYVGTRPSKSRVQRVCSAVSAKTARRWLWRDASDLAEDLNRLLRGWANYFRLGPVSKAYAAVDSHVSRRLRQWLCHKHKKTGRGTSRYPDEYLHDTLGLVRLRERTHNFSWANA